MGMNREEDDDDVMVVVWMPLYFLCFGGLGGGWILIHEFALLDIAASTCCSCHYNLAPPKVLEDPLGPIFHYHSPHNPLFSSPSFLHFIDTPHSFKTIMLSLSL